MNAPRPLHLILAVIALVAIALPLLVIRYAPAPTPHAAAPKQAHVVPQAEVPAVEPLRLRDLDPEDAKKLNEDVPIIDGPNPPAKPYHMLGGPDDVARATDCLAAAEYYEAGDDAVGEEAVAQVVINRLRHPAFPKSVCGVVFQGSERSTGCQFTFACDGALSRRPSDKAWIRARGIAAAALSGEVYKPVGYATHYHADYVVPYWSASLDKIAAVHSHLFYRWTGWWGTPRAFTRRPLTVEPPIGALAFLSSAHQMGTAMVDANGAVIAASPFFGRTAIPLPTDQNTFITSLNPKQSDSFAAMAQASCGERAKCKFMGWTDVDMLPFTTAMSPQQMSAMSFSYLRDRGSGLERTLWNCTEFKGKGRTCMKRQALRIVPLPVVPTADDADARGPTELVGVRRKSAPLVTPSPSPTPSATPGA